MKFQETSQKLVSMCNIVIDNIDILKYTLHVYINQVCNYIYRLSLT